MRTSPPGSAAAGTIDSMCGFPLTFFLPKMRSEKLIFFEPDRTILAEYGKRVDGMKKLHHDERVNPGADIVHHDPGARGKSFQLPDWRRLEDIEEPEENEASDHIFRIQRVR